MRKPDFMKRPLEDIYMDYLENEFTPASEDVSDGYKNITSALENYISSLSEFEWRNGFLYALKLCGYEWGECQNES